MGPVLTGAKLADASFVNVEANDVELPGERDCER
jgi:hypothetical protein